MGEYTSRMRKSGLIFVLLSFCPLAFAQLGSDSITVNASNNPSPQPDEATFFLSVQSGTNTSLNDVLTALQALGITAANLSSVTSSLLPIVGRAGGLVLQWTFTLPVPLTTMNATVSSLTMLQQTIGAQNSGLTLSFYIAGTQVSPQLAQSQTCSLSALIASATTQAQSLAAAGGVTLGSITALSSSTSNVAANPYGTAPPCSITATFSVARH
jgi:uncharacterized protein YggE